MINLGPFRKWMRGVKMRILGIDPGLKGAFVITDGAHFEFTKMPLKNGEIDFLTIFNHFQALGVWLPNAEKVVHVYLERAVAFGMGCTSAFNYGRGFGALECAIQSAGLPVTYVMPKKWTTVMHQGISSKFDAKKKSLIAAERLFPLQFAKIPRGPKSGKPDEGVVDALLIAGYGLRHHGVSQDTPTHKCKFTDNF